MLTIQVVVSQLTHGIVRKYLQIQYEFIMNFPFLMDSLSYKYYLKN